MTNNPVRALAQRHQRTKDQQWHQWQTRQIDQAYQLSQLSDEELIGRAPGFPGPHHESGSVRGGLTSTTMLI